MTGPVGKSELSKLDLANLATDPGIEVRGRGKRSVTDTSGRALNDTLEANKGTWGGRQARQIKVDWHPQTRNRDRAVQMSENSTAQKSVLDSMRNIYGDDRGGNAYAKGMLKHLPEMNEDYRAGQTENRPQLDNIDIEGDDFEPGPQRDLAYEQRFREYASHYPISGRQIKKMLQAGELGNSYQKVDLGDLRALALTNYELRCPIDHDAPGTMVARKPSTGGTIARDLKIAFAPNELREDRKLEYSTAKQMVLRGLQDEYGPEVGRRAFASVDGRIGEDGRIVYDGTRPITGTQIKKMLEYAERHREFDQALTVGDLRELARHNVELVGTGLNEFKARERAGLGGRMARNFEAGVEDDNTRDMKVLDYTTAKRGVLDALKNEFGERLAVHAYESVMGAGRAAEENIESRHPITGHQIKKILAEIDRKLSSSFSGDLDIHRLRQLGQSDIELALFVEDDRFEVRERGQTRSIELNTAFEDAKLAVYESLSAEYGETIARHAYELVMQEERPLAEEPIQRGYLDDTTSSSTSEGEEAQVRPVTGRHIKRMLEAAHAKFVENDTQRFKPERLDTKMKNLMVSNFIWTKVRASDPENLSQRDLAELQDARRDQQATRKAVVFNDGSAVVLGKSLARHDLAPPRQQQDEDAPLILVLEDEEEAPQPTRHFPGISRIGEQIVGLTNQVFLGDGGDRHSFWMVEVTRTPEGGGRPVRQRIGIGFDREDPGHIEIYDPNSRRARVPVNEFADWFLPHMHRTYGDSISSLELFEASYVEGYNPEGPIEDVPINPNQPIGPVKDDTSVPGKVIFERKYSPNPNQIEATSELVKSDGAQNGTEPGGTGLPRKFERAYRDSLNTTLIGRDGRALVLTPENANEAICEFLGIVYRRNRMPPEVKALTSLMTENIFSRMTGTMGGYAILPEYEHDGPVSDSIDVRRIRTEDNREAIEISYREVRHVSKGYNDEEDTVDPLNAGRSWITGEGKIVIALEDLVDVPNPLRNIQLVEPQTRELHFEAQQAGDGEVPERSSIPTMMMTPAGDRVVLPLDTECVDILRKKMQDTPSADDQVEPYIAATENGMKVTFVNLSDDDPTNSSGIEPLLVPDNLKQSFKSMVHSLNVEYELPDPSTWEIIVFRKRVDGEDFHVVNYRIPMPEGFPADGCRLRHRDDPSTRLEGPFHLTLSVRVQDVRKELGDLPNALGNFSIEEGPFLEGPHPVN